MESITKIWILQVRNEYNRYGNNGQVFLMPYSTKLKALRNAMTVIQKNIDLLEVEDSNTMSKLIENGKYEDALGFWQECKDASKGGYELSDYSIEIIECALDEEI